MTSVSTTGNLVGKLLATSRIIEVQGLCQFVIEVLARSPMEVGYFTVTLQPGLCSFVLVFLGNPPHECLEGFMWQDDEGRWHVYQWNRYWKERRFFP